MTTNVRELLVSLIEKAVQSQPKTHWDSGVFGAIKQLEIDSRGTLGETFIAVSLKDLGHTVSHNREKDVTKKHWDIRVDGEIDLEIKTATLDKQGKFQHESLTPTRNYQGLVLVDIVPNDVYVTFAAHDALPWRRPNDIFTISNRKMHIRQDGRYKWDLSLKDVISKNRKINSLADIENGYQEMLSFLT